MDKITVIIPFYNEEKYIIQCLDSVINQTYKNIEILLINNNSTDKTLKIIKEKKDKRIKILNCKKQGVAHARNVGIKKATGRYITFLDADDYWLKDKLEKQIKFIEENNYRFIYSDYLYNKNGKQKKVSVPKSLTYNQAIKNTTIFTSTVMIDTKYINKKIIEMPLLKRGEDSATWWKILKTGITAYGINEPLAYYRIKNNSLSSNKLKSVISTWKIYQLQDINIIKKIHSYMCYIINAIKRRI